MEFKGTKVFPKYEGGDNYSIDMIFDNEATISIDRRSRYTDKCVMSREEMEANALLISKAPEMIEFLTDLVSDYENGLIEDLETLVIRAENLIKKATEL